jgi:hypothetical protein
MTQRFNRAHPCPVCHGWESQQRGEGERCHGFLSDDGNYAHCAREQFAGRLSINTESSTYPHLLEGDCKCGHRHDGASATPGDKIVATYPYHDADGKLLYQAIRLEPKSFRFRRPDGNGGWIWNLVGTQRFLYRLPELLAAPVETAIHICEGERDVDNLVNLGFVATCNPAGAGKWRNEYTEHLRGRHVVLLADNDRVGNAHAQAVAKSVAQHVRSLKLISFPELPEHADVSDFLRNHTREDLERRIRQARAWHVEEATNIFESLADIHAAEGGTENQWLVKPFITVGGATELMGKIKSAGKTAFSLAMIRAVVDGTDFLAEPTKQTAVLYLTEMTGAALRQALKRAGLLAQPNLIIVRWVKTQGADWAEIAARAVKKAKESGAGLIVVDTLPQFTQLSGDSENNSGAALEAMRPLQEAQGHDIAVMIVVHERKAGGDISDAGRGSNAYGGTVDILLRLGRPSGNHPSTFRKIEILTRLNVDLEAQHNLIVELTPDGYIAHGDLDAVALEEARKKLAEQLPVSEGDAMTVDKLVETTSATRRSVQRILAELKEGHRVLRVGTGKKGDPYRYFRQSPEGPADDDEGAGALDDFKLENGQRAPVVRKSGVIQ